MNCDYCNEHIKGLSWKCKYCKQSFCNDHRLPEEHECEGLRVYKERSSERWKKNIINTAKPKKRGFVDKIKDIFR